MTPELTQNDRPRWGRGARLAFGAFVVVVLAAAVLGFVKAPNLYPLTVDPGADAAARRNPAAIDFASAFCLNAPVFSGAAASGADAAGDAK